MYFPEDIFKIIKEYNGIVGFSKQLINILRYASSDDLELILKLVAGNTPPFDFHFQFTHKQKSTERRKIMLLTIFKKQPPIDIFTKIIKQHFIMKDVHSYFNREIQINQEAFYIHGHNLHYCGIIKKINHKSVIMNCYDFELRDAENWDGTIKSFKYWIKTRFYREVIITTRINNLYINKHSDTQLVRENFIRTRMY
jgi:hypothetical protein